MSKEGRRLIDEVAKEIKDNPTKKYNKAKDTNPKWWEDNFWEHEELNWNNVFY